jgi:hypothetical protein
MLNLNNVLNIYIYIYNKIIICIKWNKDSDDSLDDNPITKAFAMGGLNTNKNLKNYDCWNDDKLPETWIKECH